MAGKAKRDTMNRLAKVGPNAAARVAGENSNDAPPDNNALLSVGEAATRLGTDKAILKAALSHHQIFHKLVPKRSLSVMPQSSEGASALQPSEAKPEGSRVRVPVELLDELRLLLDSLPQEAFRSDSNAEARQVAAIPAPVDEESPATSASDRRDNEANALGIVNRSGNDQEVTASARLNGLSDGPPRPFQAEYEVQVAQPSMTTLAALPPSLALERLLGEKDARIDDLKAEVSHLREVLEREQSAHSRTQALLSLQVPTSKPVAAAQEIAIPSGESSTSMETQAKSQLRVEPRRGLAQWFRSLRFANYGEGGKRL